MSEPDMRRKPVTRPDYIHSIADKAGLDEDDYRVDEHRCSFYLSGLRKLAAYIDAEVQPR